MDSSPRFLSAAAASRPKEAMELTDHAGIPLNAQLQARGPLKALSIEAAPKVSPRADRAPAASDASDGDESSTSAAAAATSNANGDANGAAEAAAGRAGGAACSTSGRAEAGAGAVVAAKQPAAGGDAKGGGQGGKPNLYSSLYVSLLLAFTPSIQARTYLSSPILSRLLTTASLSTVAFQSNQFQSHSNHIQS